MWVSKSQMCQMFLWLKYCCNKVLNFSSVQEHMNVHVYKQKQNYSKINIQTNGGACTVQVLNHMFLISYNFDILTHFCTPKIISDKMAIFVRWPYKSLFRLVDPSVITNKLIMHPQKLTYLNYIRRYHRRGLVGSVLAY